MSITEKQLRAMCKAGKSHQQIADETGLRQSDISAAARVLGIRSVAREIKSAERDRFLSKVLDRLAKGEPLPAIAKSEGRKFIAVYQALKRQGLPTSRYAALLARQQRGDA